MPVVRAVIYVFVIDLTYVISNNVIDVINLIMLHYTNHGAINVYRLFTGNEIEGVELKTPAIMKIL